MTIDKSLCTISDHTEHRGTNEQLPKLPVVTPSVSQGFEEYETMVMRQMRQQEERRKLIEEMQRQDALEDD